MELDYQKISLNIKSYRAKLGMKQSAVAEALDLSLRCYRTRENHPEKLTIDEVIKLADLFDTSLLSLLSIEIRQIVNSQSIGSVNGTSTSYTNDLSVIKSMYDQQIEYLKEEINRLRTIDK